MTRNLVFAAVLGLSGLAVLLGLGFWQMQRLDWKLAIIAAAEGNITATPLPLAAAPDPTADRYRAVTVSGRFTGEEAHVLTSTRDSGPGYLVIAAFEAADGRRILIDRGFIVESAKDAARPGKPADITGNLNWPDDVNTATPPYDAARAIWFGRDLAGISAALGTDPLLIIAATDTGDGITARPVTTAGFRNDHLQYAITWFSLALVWAGMTVFYIWRNRTPKA